MNTRETITEDGEIIADALRGYMSDDVWGNGGKLVRVAAAT